jgi:lysine-specific demethylase/histidyl-hydroxylase NO66
VFAERTWGREPLLARGAALATTTLLDLDDVDELLSRHGLRTPFVRLVKDGTVVETSRYTGSGGSGATVGDQVVDDRVLRLLLDGTTVVLQALHRSWPPVMEFGAALSAELRLPVQVNAYVTPPSSTGFSAHYDVHDVFVVQTSGRKRWRLHAPVHPAPLADQPWTDHRAAVAARAAEEPLLDVVLEPGDVLYLPRGTVHAADALGDVSVHLTVGVHPLTRQSVLRALADAMTDDPRLRASLPLGTGLDDDAVWAAELATVAGLLGESVAASTPDALAARVLGRVVRDTRPSPLSPLAQLRAIATLSARTGLTVRPGLQTVLTTTPDDGVRLRLPDRVLTFPAASAKAVQAATSGPVVAGDLPGLDPAESLELALRLLREGVLVPDGCS